MSWNYCCPRCKVRLDPGRSIVLVATHEDTRILIGFHPKPGKYDVYLPPGVTTRDGTLWDFTCPVCRADLVTTEDGNLCELELWVDDTPVRILFSRIAGEHATFIVYGDTLKEKHGPDADRYDELWDRMKSTRG